MNSTNKAAFDKKAFEKKAFKLVPYLIVDKLYLPLSLFATQRNFKVCSVGRGS